MANQLPELDFAKLDRELDRVKTKVFLGNNAAFLGRLLCTVNFVWSTGVPTAATDGTTLWWNPYYFHFLPPEGRISILIHELWHVGLMHMLRRGNRDPQVWNWACDTVLDNMMDLEGYCVDSRLYPVELGFPAGSKTFVDHAKYGTQPAEEIYEDMIKNRPPPPPSGGGTFGQGSGTGKPGDPGNGTGDLVEPTGNPAANHTIINNVVAAVHASKLGGKSAGSLPGNLEEILSKFLAPKLPWAQILFNFFSELGEQDYSLARPNRRYQDVYMSSLMDQEGALAHLIYYEDVSGSISTADAIRFNSEFKYVKDTFQPEKMTMVQFDTRIQKEDVFLKDDPFEEIRIVGRGGTSLACVRDHIIKHEPTAVVVFSDMYCAPMEPLPAGLKIPIIWIAINNRDAKVHQGTLVHLNE